MTGTVAITTGATGPAAPGGIMTTVQAGRGIAAAMVVFHHASTMFALPRYGNMPVWDGWGELGRHGIDFFFVLSGFIIFSAHRRDIGRPGRIGAYLWRRAIRIYPVYWLYLCGFLALLLLGMGRQEVPLSAANLLTAFSLVRFTPEMPPLQVAWTLFHEVFFYAMFVLLLASRRMGTAALGLWLALILLFHQSRGADGLTFFSVAFDLLNLEFFMGIAVSLLWRHVSARAAAAALGLGLGGLAGAGLSAQGGWIGGYLPSFCFGLASALILLGLVVLEGQGRLRAPRWLSALGDASYTTYLLHTTILSALLRVAAHHVGGGAMAQLFPVLIALAAIAVSLPFYHYVERPLLDALRGRRPFAARREGAVTA